MSDLTPQRRTILYIEDMIEYARDALTFMEGASELDLEQDRKLQYAVVRALEVVGEAARSVPEEVRALAPEVPWRSIVTMRNKIVHHYFGVRLDAVWVVVREDLEPLIASMQTLLAELQRRESNGTL